MGFPGCPVVRFHTSTAGVRFDAWVQGTKIPHVSNYGPKWKKKEKEKTARRGELRDKGGVRMLSVNLAFSKVLLVWGGNLQSSLC